ncbi:MAG: thioredoxin domain-containing protein [Thermoplasmata archaeon]
MSENGVFDASTQDWDREVLGSDLPVAVDFWHENCSWCIRLDPVYKEVSQEYQGKMKFAKLHVFNESDIANRYGIMGTPTIKFFCGGHEVYEIVGFRSSQALKQEIDKVLATYKECLDSITPLGE